MLNNVVSLAALIARLVARGDSDRILSYTQRLQRAAGRMDRLVGDLVDVASIHAGMLAVTRELADPSHVVAEAVETERFLQVDATDRRGLGLGLYISKCIVLGHGGRIWAESTPGEGCAFHFTLPIVAPALTIPAP